MTSFATLCRELIEDPFVVLDIGADGGVHEMEGLASSCEVHAFEPRQESFEELMDFGSKKRYSKVFLHNKGLAGSAGQHTLFVTRIPQGSSLRKPNAHLAQRWRGDNGFDVINTIQVDCTTLEQFMKEAGLNYIDLIKLDTQGSELEILLGAGDLLRNISIIISEIEFIQLYEGQALFDEIVRELSARGFRFVGFCGDKDVVDNKLFMADCMFIRNAFDSYENAIKAAMILIEKTFYEDARWVLADHGVPTDTWQRLAKVHMAEIHPWSEWLANANNLLKGIAGNIGPIESLRRKIVQVALRHTLGRAAYLIGGSRKL